MLIHRIFRRRQFSQLIGSLRGASEIDELMITKRKVWSKLIGIFYTFITIQETYLSDADGMSVFEY